MNSNVYFNMAPKYNQIKNAMPYQNKHPQILQKNTVNRQEHSLIVTQSGLLLLHTILSSL